MRHQSTSGIALVAVLLIGTVVLLSMAFTASITMLGARTGTTDERVAFQGLLAAESGVNSIERRVAALPEPQRYRGPLEQAPLDAWLRERGLSALALRADASTTIGVTSVDPATRTVALESRSSVAGGHGRQRVLTDYYLDRGGNQPLIHAALTSYGNVEMRGNAIASGSGVLSTGVVAATQIARTVTLPGSSDAPFDLTVADGQRLDAGRYLSVAGTRYRIERKVGNTVTLRPLQPTSFLGQTLLAGSPVDVIPWATTAGLPGDTPIGTLPVTDATAYVPGDTLYVGPYVATVTGIDLAGNTLSVSWSPAAPNALAPLAEGTPVRRHIFGVASGNGVDEGSGQIRILNGESEYDSVRVPDPAGARNALFEQTFRMTEEEFKRIATVTTAKPPTISGLIYLDGGWQNNGVKLCGSGVLVVNGDFKESQTCDAGFTGILYVMGDFDISGNMTIDGAVIAEEPTPKINGSNGKGVKIRYDPGVIVEMGELFLPWTFTSVPGTWRQR